MKKLFALVLLFISLAATADWQVADPVSPTFTAPVGTLCTDTVIYSNAGIDYHGVTIGGFTAPFQCEQVTPPPPPPPGSIFGLEWPGDAHVTHVRRMLRWANALPAFPATYIMQVLPRKKLNHHAYFTGFFWENVSNAQGVGAFSCNTMYYGAHPYPVPAPSGAGRFESGFDCADPTWNQEVQWDRWYTMALIAKANGGVGSSADVDLYFDLPDTSKMVHNHGYIRSNFSTGHIVMGQSPSDPTMPNQSWGGYDGWEEFNGVIRGIQIYSAVLTTTEITQEVAQPMSTAKGAASIWYLNLNPRPSDVADKKGVGMPHDPIWIGTTALEWTQ